MRLMVNDSSPNFCISFFYSTVEIDVACGCSVEGYIRRRLRESVNAVTR